MREVGFLQRDGIGLGDREDMLQFQSQFQNRSTHTTNLKKKDHKRATEVCLACLTKGLKCVSIVENVGFSLVFVLG